MGDERIYEYIVVLRFVNIIDFMIVIWFYLFYEFLEKVFNRILNEVKGINRLIYDIFFKLFVIIEWE